jgi:hypothetical protein
MAMFGMDKKIKEASKDPEKAMDMADKALNKGVSGFMTKAFMGKDFVNDMNQTMEKGRDAMAQAAEYQKNAQNPAQFGLDGTAAVVSIQDTGTTINDNPVVILQLKVTPQYEPAFDTTTQLMVSRLAIPRVGDTIKIKYNPTDHSKILIL